MALRCPAAILWDVKSVIEKDLPLSRENLPGAYQKAGVFSRKYSGFFWYPQKGGKSARNKILAKRGYDKFILKDEQDEGYKKNIETKLNKIL